MRRPSVALGLLATLVVAAGPACRSERQAQLVVVVHSDMTIPGELDAFRARVRGPQGDLALDRQFSLGDGASAVRLPTDFGVAPRGGDVRRRVTIEVDAIHAGETLFTTTAITTFLPKRRLRVDMFLARSCIERARECDPDETCRREGCVPPEIDPTDLPEWDPGQRYDAGVALPDAGLDAAVSPPDAAAEPDAAVPPREIVPPFLPEGLPDPPAGSVLTLGDGAIIDTDAATITGAVAGVDFVSEQVIGPGDVCVPLTVFRAERIVVTGAVRARGAAALALVATEDLDVQAGAVLDVSGEGSGAGPGGYVGGTGDASGSGPGGGGLGSYVSTVSDSGGGGAGYGGTGGPGGDSQAAPGGTGGPVWGSFDVLCGGSGGGAAWAPIDGLEVLCPDGRGAAGGGGGGAALLVALTGTVGIDGAVDVGGDGGRGSVGCGGGGGGGSGGMVVLAGLAVEVRGVVAAGGGGGGGGNHGAPAAPGDPGCVCATPAAGGAGGANGERGGVGGAGLTPSAEGGIPHNYNAGGGGGAAGRIVLLAAGGSPPVISGVLSPDAATEAVRIGDLPER